MKSHGEVFVVPLAANQSTTMTRDPCKDAGLKTAALVCPFILTFFFRLSIGFASQQRLLNVYVFAYDLQRASQLSKLAIFARM